MLTKFEKIEIIIKEVDGYRRINAELYSACTVYML